MFIILILGFCPLVTRTSGGFRLNCYLFTVKGGFVTRFREEKHSIYNHTESQFCGKTLLSWEKMATEIYANLGLALRSKRSKTIEIERSKTRRETGTYKTTTGVKRIKYTVYRQNH